MAKHGCGILQLDKQFSYKCPHVMRCEDIPFGVQPELSVDSDPAATRMTRMPYTPAA